MRKKVKICLACSPGGHFHQLCLATNELQKENHDIYWILLKNKHLKKFSESRRCHFVVNTTMNRFTWIINSVQSLFFLFVEKPDVIISSGAGMAFPTMFFGKKIFRAKIIYLCSAANVEHPSRTPYKAYKISDLFLIQWPELKKIFPNSVYIGAL